MRFVRRTVGDRALFIIVDLDAAYHGTAHSLGYVEVDGGFAAMCPATSPHVDRAFQNFQRYVEPLILQTARVQPAPWERCLLEWLELVQHEPIDWWLKGSAAVAVRGLPVAPKDIDLVVADEDTGRMDELLAEWLIQPTVSTPGWVHNSFGRSFLYCCLEWCGGVNPSADATFQSDQGPVAAGRLETVEWRGYRLCVPPLDLHLETSRRRGLDQRADLILRAMERP